MHLFTTRQLESSSTETSPVRALALAEAQAYSVSTIEIKPDGSMVGLSEVILNEQPKAGAILIVHLPTFIAQGLKLQIVLDVWPDLTCPSFSHTTDDKNTRSLTNLLRPLVRHSDRNEHRDLAEAKSAIREFLERVYARKRLHSAIGYVPLAEFDACITAQQSERKDAAARQLL